MAQPRNYTSASLARTPDSGVIEQIAWRRQDVIDALNCDRAWKRPVSDYTEGKAAQLERIYGEAERRGLL